MNCSCRSRSYSCGCHNRCSRHCCGSTGIVVAYVGVAVIVVVVVAAVVVVLGSAVVVVVVGAAVVLVIVGAAVVVVGPAVVVICFRSCSCCRKRGFSYSCHIYFNCFIYLTRQVS
jgi:hypothetical protein